MRFEAAWSSPTTVPSRQGPTRPGRFTVFQGRLGYDKDMREDEAVNYQAIMKAAERLAGQAVETPLLASDRLSERLGCRLLVKAEALQRGGAFKFRGAFNAIRALVETDPARATRGVIAYSSGNHAQAVALAARLNGLPAVIVMPSDAPAVKMENTRAYGAEVMTYDRYRESREAIAADIAAKRGLNLVPPFDHPDVIAGQGTVGLEIARQCGALKMKPDLLLVPCSGGGLVAGAGLALRECFPQVQVLAVEPEGYDDTGLSLRRGERVSVAPVASTLCDSLALTEPGRLTFEINRHLLSGALTVSDAEALRAMATAMNAFKLVLEPGGAVALAAALFEKIPVQGKTVVVVASGGNVDGSVLTEALALGGSAEVGPSARPRERLKRLRDERSG